MSVYQIYIRKQEHNKIETEIFIPNQIRLVISDLDKLFSRSNILLEIYIWPLARNFIMVLTRFYTWNQRAPTNPGISVME